MNEEIIFKEGGLDNGGTELLVDENGVITIHHEGNTLTIDDLKEVGKYLLTMPNK